jgi:hypothetical protein
MQRHLLHQQLTLCLKHWHLIDCVPGHCAAGQHIISNCFMSLASALSSLCSMLYKLLKHTCLNCHQFKMGRQEVSPRTGWQAMALGQHLVRLPSTVSPAAASLHQTTAQFCPHLSHKGTLKCTLVIRETISPGTVVLLPALHPCVCGVSCRCPSSW